MENRIKEQQLALFADRTSSSKWWTNQYRVLLAALAYTLLETMRRTALRGDALGPGAVPNPSVATAENRRGRDSKYPHRRDPALQLVP